MQLVAMKFVTMFFLAIYPLLGQAYVGPGLGAGALGLIIGIIGSVILALFAVLWYPLKRMIKRFKNNKYNAAAGPADGPDKD